MEPRVHGRHGQERALLELPRQGRTREGRLGRDDFCWEEMILVCPAGT